METTLRAWLKETGDLTLAELCARLAGHGIAINVPALWHQLGTWKLTLTKILPASEQARADVQGARREVAGHSTGAGYHEAGLSG